MSKKNDKTTEKITGKNAHSGSFTVKSGAVHFYTKTSREEQLRVYHDAAHYANREQRKLFEREGRK
jgi:hypothetical protein